MNQDASPSRTARARRANAAVFASVVGEMYGIELTADRSGAEWLDRFFQTRRDDLDFKTRADLVELVGSFLGECIVREFQGEWQTVDGRDFVALPEGGVVDPFWMVESCCRDPKRLTASALFAAVPHLARVRIGGFYAVAIDDGSFAIYEVLDADDRSVAVRSYRRRFAERPLRIDADVLEEEAEGSTSRDAVPRLHVAHRLLTHEAFGELTPTPVASDGVEILP